MLIVEEHIPSCTRRQW